MPCVRIGAGLCVFGPRGHQQISPGHRPGFVNLYNIRALNGRHTLCSASLFRPVGAQVVLRIVSWGAAPGWFVGAPFGAESQVQLTGR